MEAETTNSLRALTLAYFKQSYLLNDFGFMNFVNLASASFHENNFNKMPLAFNGLDVNVLNLPDLVKDFSSKYRVKISDEELPQLLEAIRDRLAERLNDDRSELFPTYANPINIDVFVMKAAEDFYVNKDNKLIIADIENISAYLVDLAFKKGLTIPPSKLFDAASDVLVEIDAKYNQESNLQNRKFSPR